MTEKTLTATPRVAIVCDFQPENPGANPPTPSNRPVVIHWRAEPRFNLQIKFTYGSCTEPPRCNGQGECTAVVKPLDGGQNRRCTYEMINADQPAKADDEADIIITPCCW